MSLTVGSLFSGIGGLDLGLERAGMTVKWQSEIDPYASKVLAKHWPHVPNLGDVTKIEWEMVERVDLICGGFPCQPVSRAGRKRAQDDERWLWPEVVRCLRGIRPRYLLVENVPGLLTHGLGHVLGDLAELGFDAEWESIPAAAVGAPHLRDRVFIVAWSEHRRDLADTNGAGLGERRRSVAVQTEHGPAECGGEEVAHPDGARRPVLEEDAQGRGLDGGRPGADPATRSRSEGIFAGGRPGDAGWWAVEPAVGRVAYGVPHRVDRLRALGNAVVPQVAQFIGEQLIRALEPA